jgi:DNA-binding MarR family transcriptional regulator
MAERRDRAVQASQVVALLPVLRRWVSGRVQQAGAECDLSMRQFAALKGIRDGASSPGELARLWQVTPAVITGIVDRLERRQLVRREPDPHDRRRLRLALTDAGIAASVEIDRVLIGDLAGELGKASPEELAGLSQSLALLERAFAALDARTGLREPACEDEEMPLWSVDETVHHEAFETRSPLLASRNQKPMIAG